MRYGVILAGGGGTRLWPASRRTRPKQFLPLGREHDRSLLAATSTRLLPVCPVERQVVVTAADQVALVKGALPTLAPGDIIAEPVARNTAAAIGLAAVTLLHRDPDAVLGVMPADHHVSDPAGFAATIARAFEVAETEPTIATIGIVPTRPETGYGYVQVGDELSAGASHGARVVRQFVEKPDAETAGRYLAAGDYLWNAGLFFTRADRLVHELQTHLPATHRGLCEIADALAAGGQDQADQVAARVYPEFESISIDFGVMEKAEHVATIPGEFGWNDVGSWSALADYRDADADGNVVSGVAVLCDAKNNIVVGDGDHIIATAFVSDLVIVQSGDAILVLPKSKAQNVRDIVAALKARNLDRFL